MKAYIVVSAIIVLLSGCVVAPIPGGHVVVQPSIEIVYVWDPIRLQYYYVDRGNRYYRHHGWGNHRYPHGGPRYYRGY